MKWWVLISKTICATLNYIEHFLTLAFAVTICICITAFVSLVDASNWIVSFTKKLNNYAIPGRINKYKWINNRNNRKHNEIELLAKTNLVCIKGSISRSLTQSYNESNYFLWIDVLRKNDDIKEKINKNENS